MKQKRRRKVRLVKITVVGAGYVGLSLAILFSSKYPVTLLDVDEEKIKKINRGISPLKEKAIEEALGSKTHILFATRNSEDAFLDADFIIIAVPTNYDEEKDFFDTSILDSMVEKAIEQNENAVVVIKSTIPVHYTEKISEKLDTNRIVFSPEFMREGSSLYDVSNPSRIVVGFTRKNIDCVNNAAKFSSLYSAFVKNRPEIMMVLSSEAEAIKLFSNAYLAMRVAFFNELDSFAEQNGMHTDAVIRGVCADPRIGKGYSNPSFGFGGYCLPKDTRQLASQMKNIPGSLIKAIPESNDIRIKSIAEKIAKKTNGVIGIYGLAMKTGSDNDRASSSRRVAKELRDMGRDVIVYDPTLANRNKDFTYAKSIEEFFEKASLVISNRMPDDDEFKKYVKEHGEVSIYTRDFFNNH